MTEITGRIWLDGDTIVSKRTQDVEPILDMNKAMQNEPQKRAASFRHVASVPMVVIEQWINESGVNLLALPKDEFARFVKKKLLNPDYFFLKTTGGRL